MHEELIVAGLKRHDEMCLQHTMQLYGKLVYYIIGKIVGNNESSVEELASDTFMDIWKKAVHIDLSKGTLKNLICLIARHNALNYLKSINKYKNILLLDEIAEEEAVDMTPESMLIEKEDFNALKSAIESMKEPDSSIFMLRYLYHFTISDIAEHMNMNRAQVDNHLSKGRKKLKAKLDSVKGLCNENE